MRILFLGDIMGRAGRDAVKEYLPGLREKLVPDVVIVNVENAAHGSGVTDKICREIYDAGADVLTLGNHAWGKKEIFSYIDSDPTLVRPENHPGNPPGRGHCVFQTQAGKKILVANFLGRLFMDPIMDDPFAAAEKLLKTHRPGANIDAAFFDFHAEATSEKIAFGHIFDGRVSAVIGTHTHVPTADAQILEHGTAYLSDAGMCGDYDSVIGVKKDFPMERFTRKLTSGKKGPADGPGTVCGAFIETDGKGLARRIAPVRVGARLQETVPEV